jgi:hypothetical protein
MLQKIRFFDKKDPKLSLSELFTYQAKSVPLQREFGRVALP